jgi:hypothetical protein
VTVLDLGLAGVGAVQALLYMLDGCLTDKNCETPLSIETVRRTSAWVFLFRVLHEELL